MKIRKPSKNEAPRLPNSTFRTRGLTRSSPANLSSPALVIPSPSVIIHPPLHALLVLIKRLSWKFAAFSLLPAGPFPALIYL